MRRRIRRTGKGEEVSGIFLAPLLQQREDVFAYEVISRTLDRSADGNRFVDSLLFALMAAQAAIYAIMLDKLKEYPAVGWEPLLGGFLLAMIGSGLTLFVRDGPDPEDFATDFPDDPQRTRRQYIDGYVVKATRNERLRVAKVVILALSLGLTAAPLIIATAHRATGV